MRRSQKILEDCIKLQTSKASDYTNNQAFNQFENFDRQSFIMSWFNLDIDKSFAGLIALKLARLSSLLNKKVNPVHESIEDTFKDGANYFALWGGLTLGEEAEQGYSPQASMGASNQTDRDYTLKNTNLAGASFAPVAVSDGRCFFCRKEVNRSATPGYVNSNFELAHQSCYNGATRQDNQAYLGIK